MKNKLHRHGATGLGSIAVSAALAGVAFAGQGTGELGARAVPVELMP